MTIAARALAVLLFAVSILGARPTLAAPEYQQRVYAVTVNSASLSNGTVVLQAADGSILVAGDDLERWRLIVIGKVPRTVFEGRPFFALSDFAGLVARVDEGRQALDIRAPAALFQTTTLDGLYDSTGRVINRSHGGFLNYTFTGGRVGTDSFEQGIFEAGVSALRGGVFTTSVGWQPTTSAAKFVRLASTWERDYVEARKTLRIGDAVSSPGRLGGTLSFAGVQYASDFATDPEFSTTPGIEIRGLAPTASMVDVLVNNAEYVTGQRVPAGPFVLSGVPLGIDGQGQIRVIVRDALGVQHVVIEPFYQTRSLLKPGVDEFSYEAGFTRNSLGSSSLSYGKPLLSGTLRHGFTNSYTGEAHVEATPDVKLAEFTADVTFPRLGLVSAGLATSFTPTGAGARALLGYQFRSVKGFAIGASFTGASRDFRTIGIDSLGGLSGEVIVTVPVHTLAASVGLLASRSLDNAQSSSFVTFGLSGRLGAGSLNLSSTQTLSGIAPATYFLGYSTRVGHETINTRANSGLGTNRISTDVQTDLPASGFGSAFDVGFNKETGSSPYLSGGYVLETPVLHFDASVDRGTTFGTLRGGLTFVGGKLFATRGVTSSYGLAIVPGYPNVRVYVNGLEAGRTDRNGMVGLPFLIPYALNRITVEQSDLPISANFARFVETTVPYLHNATIVRFKTGPAGGVVIHLQLADGTPVPVGSFVATSDSTNSYPVGQEGLTYLAALPLGRNAFKVVLADDGSCTFAVDVPRDTSEIPDLGNVLCAGAAPVPSPAPTPHAAPTVPEASSTQVPAIAPQSPAAAATPSVPVPTPSVTPSPSPRPATVSAASLRL